MLTFARRPKPGTRRVLDAIRSMASDAEELPNKGAVDPRMESFLNPRNRKVPHLYREVLATQDMPQAERASIRDRPDRGRTRQAGSDARELLACNFRYQNAA